MAKKVNGGAVKVTRKRGQDIASAFADSILSRMSAEDRKAFEAGIMEAIWGARCPDDEPGCPVCDAWAQFDAEGYSVLPDGLKSRPMVDD